TAVGPGTAGVCARGAPPPPRRFKQRIPARVQQSRAEDGERYAESELHRATALLRCRMHGQSLRSFERDDEMRKRRGGGIVYLREIVPQADCDRVRGKRLCNERVGLLGREDTALQRKAALGVRRQRVKVAVACR